MKKKFSEFKFSIIVPVFNEGSFIFKTLKALSDSNFPKQFYEIIVMDDNSSDDSVNNSKKFKKENPSVNLRIFSNKTNLGRSNNRYLGAKKAKSENLVFIDSRCIPFPENLRVLEKLILKYEAIVGNAIIDSSRSYIDRFFYLFYMKLYNLNKDQEFRDFLIKSKNFDKSPKGTGVFFCKKVLFLNSQIENREDKNSSDDTKLLKNILSKTNKIYKSSKFKVVYNNRNKLFSIIVHTFNRGPKFIDYYYKPNRKPFKIINLVLALSVISALFLVIFPKVILLYLSLGIIGIVLISFRLSLNFRDFIINLFLWPIVISSFGFGILKGLFIKLFYKIKV